MNQFIQTKVFDDPTNGLINTRFIHSIIKIANSCEFNDEEKQVLFDLLILIGKKLANVWIHYNNFSSIQEKLISDAKNKPILSDNKVITLNPSQELFFEFDDFLVQVKSCLDYLVKLPVVPFGQDVWSIRTFSKEGQGVIKALQKNIPDVYKSKAKGLIIFIEKNKNWLEETISARDKINHFLDGGIDFRTFNIYVLKRKGEEDHINIPMWSSEQSICEFMQVVWNNLFRFCEDFSANTVYFRIKKGLALFHGLANLNSIESPWKVTTETTMEKIVNKPGWSRVE